MSEETHGTRDQRSLFLEWVLLTVADLVEIAARAHGSHRPVHDWWAEVAEFLEAEATSAERMARITRDE